MRKLFALTLAVAMVLSLASVAFAYTTFAPTSNSDSPKVPVNHIGDDAYKMDTDSGVMKTVPEAGLVGYGSTIYYPLFANVAEQQIIGASDAVKGVKPKVKWDMNGDYVTKTEIVKKKYAESPNAYYGYYLAVTFKDSTQTTITDVTGSVEIKKSGTDYGFSTIKKDVSVSLRYDAPSNYDEITDSNKTFNFKTLGLQNEDQELTIKAWDGARFTADLTGQSGLVLMVDTKYNAAVAAKYPIANLDFFNGNGASFNKIGELVIPCAEGSYIYTVNEDGTLSKANATYDDYEEAFVVKTRTLGKYVVSDTELNLAATAPGVDVVPGTPSVTPPSVVTPANPGTGAAA